jgi:phosphoribosylanthranilate isomerase
MRWPPARSVDAIGLVLTHRSKRRRHRQHAISAARCRLSSPSSLCSWDDEPGFIAEAIATVRPDLLQFHGSEERRIVYATDFRI